MVERSKLRLLLLDDEPFILKLMGRMLMNLGFTSVTLCDNGASALEQVDGVPDSPDLILCDMNMPHMDGVEFLRRLVEHNYSGSLILVSGEDRRALQAMERLARAHGIDVLGTLQKPVTSQGLSDLIVRWTPVQPEALASRKTYSFEDLREGISRDELMSYFQPQVEVATGQLVGVESLVRWRHSRDGIVFPDQFVSVAEQHGLIDELTRVVVIKSLAQLRRWHDAGMTLRLAINLSMDNLSSLDFVDFMTNQAAAAGVAPQGIVLEVTESRLMQDLRAPLEVLTRLRLKRFRLSIDDFGTGHSSLAQLRDVPFDELKIDRGFVHGASFQERARALYGASLGLAKQLDMDTVAEGVEDRCDWDLLRQTGCYLAQGYFIGRPMPGGELRDWLVDWMERVNHEGLVDAPSGKMTQE